ncbi:MAG: N(4)-(beta-N-acetylglucosaminyl)-L-asparaginase [Lewinellaceae bacterium]|nr:N(4)-(beta-N-acetylglucosaminyl)-L-asparaginase [Saprospiraceae bacterium]MCB9340716.1 N(4)-(beta-N-acetylglucosaminyl)-L-asparaginase [Lewinellaceae bacterium]
MVSRRKFLAQTALGALPATLGIIPLEACSETNSEKKLPEEVLSPMVISTWDFGRKANAEAWKVLSNGGSALDAAEKGVMLIEADENNASVGYGGLPDRDGRVALDACIMAPDGNCGAVCSIEHIMHPVSVARKVMEDTPHVILVGDGALEFALSKGFKKENLLTEKARLAWEEWKVESKYEPKINVEQHDTIGMLVMDKNGDLAGACTTSGLAFKMRGRVGDSPIIGAGMYVDNEVGGAAATGLGEAVLKVLGSFLIVELMRQGSSPQAACEEAVHRIVKKQAGYENFQVGFIAMNKKGETGAFSIQPAFTYALKTEKNDNVNEAGAFLKK